MKLYNSIGPNPRLVKMFAAEKGLKLELVEVDIIGGESRQPAYLAINPTGTTPVLAPEGGRPIAETTAICEYLEEQQAAPPLIGATPAARAEARMWWRRVDLLVV
ncbi:MAG: glutathione S-transferase N-terminal domain-containing protein, partial [Zoogloea sp.]|nr:glutathione S-transferase N-terminal domain-containing protein [Zoogloea sp.]